MCRRHAVLPLQVTQHGACLGLGLAGLGSGDDEVFEDLKNVLYLDSAVAGEAAGLALGLLHVGTATEKAGEMLAYAHDTQHEKVAVHCCDQLLMCTVVCFGTEQLICDMRGHGSVSSPVVDSLLCSVCLLIHAVLLSFTQLLTCSCCCRRSSVALLWVWL